MHLDLGPRGVYIAITVAFSTLAVVSAIVFRRGVWNAPEGIGATRMKAIEAGF